MIGIRFHFLDKLLLDLRSQPEVFAERIEFAYSPEELLKLRAEALASHRDHLGHQQPGDHAVLLRNMAANGQPRTLFAANRNLVLIDQLADVLEAHRRLVKRN